MKTDRFCLLLILFFVASFAGVISPLRGEKMKEKDEYIARLAEEADRMELPLAGVEGNPPVNPEHFSRRLYPGGEAVSLTRDLRRLRMVRQSFTAGEMLLTGMSLDVRTFTGGVGCHSFRFRISDAATGRVLREGFLREEGEGKRAKLHAHFRSLYSMEERKYTLDIYRAFPPRRGALQLKVVHDKGSGGSLTINGHKKKGVLMVTLHGIKAFRFKKEEVKLPAKKMKNPFSHKKYFLYPHREITGGVSLFLVERKTGKPLFMTPLLSDALGPERASLDAVGRVHKFIQDGVLLKPCIDGISEGGKTLTVSWRMEPGVSHYRVFRADSPGGPWRLAGKTPFFIFRDRGAEPGRVYWYRVQALKGDTTSIPSLPRRGYRTPGDVQGKDLYALLDKKNAPAEKPAGPGEKKLMEQQRAWLDRYHMNPFTLTIALFVARAYLGDGTITVLNTFDSYTTDTTRSRLYAVRPGKYAALLYSHKFFRIIEEGRGAAGNAIKVTFGTKGNFRQFKTTGLKVAGNHTCIAGDKGCSLVLPLKKKMGEMQLNLLLRPRTDRKNKIFYRVFRLRVNSEDAGTFYADGKGWYQLDIPARFNGCKKLKIEIFSENEISRGGGRGSLYIIKANLVAKKPGVLLKKRLIKNSILFTVPAGHVEYTSPAGETSLLPLFKAAGIATEYFKNFNSWRSNTLLLSTSDGKLKSRIKKAWKNK